MSMYLNLNLKNECEYDERKNLKLVPTYESEYEREPKFETSTRFFIWKFSSHVNMKMSAKLKNGDGKE